MPKGPRAAEPKPFKDEVGEPSVRLLGEAVASLHPAFALEAFVARSLDGLDALELKGRIGQIATALDEGLAHLAPGKAFRLVADAVDAVEPKSMWALWPTTTFIEVRSLEDPAEAVDALGRITPFSSAEFALRPLLDAHPDETLTALEAWVADDDQHLRRAASESTRPRLPWGRRLKGFVADPTPVIARILDRLHDDPQEYVRRSVANNLNDIAKDHPELAVATARRWLAEGGDGSARTVRHALRSLVKAGDADALAVLGYAADAPVVVEDLVVRTPTVTVGEALEVSFTLRNEGGDDAHVVVDYVVHHRRADGSLGPKVFKLTTRTLAPGEVVALTKRHPMRPVTIRTYHPGEHLVAVQVNGRVQAEERFHLRLS
jgi:3-methyladenine DNA glycosylase AlkC